MMHHWSLRTWHKVDFNILWNREPHMSKTIDNPPAIRQIREDRLIKWPWGSTNYQAIWSLLQYWSNTVLKLESHGIQELCRLSTKTRNWIPQVLLDICECKGCVVKRKLFYFSLSCISSVLLFCIACFILCNFVASFSFRVELLLWFGGSSSWS